MSARSSTTSARSPLRRGVERDPLQPPAAGGQREADGGDEEEQAGQATTHRASLADRGRSVRSCRRRIGAARRCRRCSGAGCRRRCAWCGGRGAFFTGWFAKQDDVPDVRDRLAPRLRGLRARGDGDQRRRRASALLVVGAGDRRRAHAARTSPSCRCCSSSASVRDRAADRRLPVSYTRLAGRRPGDAPAGARRRRAAGRR